MTKLPLEFKKTFFQGDDKTEACLLRGLRELGYEDCGYLKVQVRLNPYKEVGDDSFDDWVKVMENSG